MFGEYEIPIEANYIARDKDNKTYWFSCKPHLYKSNNTWATGKNENWTTLHDPHHYLGEVDCFYHEWNKILLKIIRDKDKNIIGFKKTRIKKEE